MSDKEKVSPFNVLPKPDQPALVEKLILIGDEREVIDWFNENIDMNRNDLIRGLVRSVAELARNVHTLAKRSEKK